MLAKKIGKSELQSKNKQTNTERKQEKRTESQRPMG